jgi:hypothetical protein
MIKFKYRLPDNLVPLVNKTIVDYGYDFLYGLMPEGIAYQLRHCSMYLICELESHNNLMVHRNPVAVVERNQQNAMDVYIEATGNKNGTILCEIIDRCDNISVEPC